uniref:CSON014749 protein n=1 Tax=Culicoides sonorensis TaxID=179676 RepID=A0A336MFL7_CULSO
MLHLYFNLLLYFWYSSVLLVTCETWTISSNKLDEKTLLEIPEENRKLGLKDIDLSGNNLTYINSNMFSQFTDLMKLNMNHNRFYSFAGNKPFLIHTKVDSYSCASCGIIDIFNQTLMMLPELSSLDLSDNLIEYISPHAFYHNLKLNLLNLESNRLKSLNEQGYLHQMRNIGYLFLSGNNEFNFLDSRPITVRTNVLKVFKCDGCAIDGDVCKSIMRNYPKMLELRLRDNKLKYFNCTAPTQSYEIDVSGNPITELKVSGKKLVRFYCNNCSITTINDEIFKNAPLLETIELSSSQIQIVHENSFKSNKYLTDLRLDSNMIGNFSQKFIESMPKLTNLCVDKNKMCPSYENTLFKRNYIKRKLRKTCGEKDTFEKLLPDINSTNGKILCEKKVSYTRSIDVFPMINLTHQDLAFISNDYFENTDAIKILNISHNPELTFVENQPFLIHSYLEEIDLSHCGVKAVYRETFSELPNLIRLDLTHNKISYIPANIFTRNLQLQDLILDSNSITSLSPDAFKDTPKLTRLSMNHNKDYDFDEKDIFLDHPLLQEFICYNCSVSLITIKTFSKMPNLRKLVLSSNNIEEIESGSFDTNVHLNYMNFDKNYLKSFDVNLIRELAELKILCLDENSEFEYDSNKNSNDELRKIYIDKNLRSPLCAADGEDRYFENLLKRNEVATTPKMIVKQVVLNKMNHVPLNEISEPKTKISKEVEIVDTMPDTDYEDRPIQIDNEKKTENDGNQNDDTKIVKVGSIGGYGNFANHITGNNLLMISSLYVLIRKIIIF